MYFEQKFNMCGKHRNLKWTLTLMFLCGVLCSEWRVDYQQKHICTVKGSSVVILCSFLHPRDRKVERVMWAHESSDIYNGPFIFDSQFNNISSRFQYIGDKDHNCSFNMQQVEHNDRGKYTFRFTTNHTSGKWTGISGSTVNIVDLNISVIKPDGNETLKEGDSVNLTCVNSCDDDNLSSAFTWFKNGEPIDEGLVLYLRNMSATNSGNYTCSLKSQTGTTSRVVHIDVEPRQTTATRDGLIIGFSVATLLILAAVVPIRRLRKKETQSLDTDCEGDIQNPYLNWPVLDASQSEELCYATVDFHSNRKSDTLQQMDSPKNEDSVMYSTVCRK